MNNKHLWFLHDGSYLENEDAYKYMLDKQARLNDLINEIAVQIDQIKALNTFKTVLGDTEPDDYEYFSEENIFDTLCTTLENLSTVSVITETLTERINEEISND